ncbi:uncharacterized protein Z518_00145 [Rhinocladiella mackenziei CBS 650.93]|uniref:Rhinocladiella mackenziei CBS 650.93 unplaced genomic scaffold supercont1.1, whole genome shotgun sequence n=1 Tax=Rhinocladiella mackenziei CBS 650.93 TaxID=1442369 RepID=A0A0D2G3E4_9EURO|nr:uncharacterized protein Z518_00145 [Rhinocladiella mackenziei CBS 650.93]KIX09067.1 hypothetical protein Z518_00145 [Rhinocladiella mackenziei CBS 650.93]
MSYPVLNMAGNKADIRLRHTCIYGVNTPEVQKISKASQQTSTADHCPPSASSLYDRDRNCVISQNSGQLVNTAHSAVPTRLVSISDEYCLGIPSSLVRTLVEVYYSHVYNASLLLHKRSFLEALASGTARPHVVLSVCAWASNFYRDHNDEATLKDHGFSTEWAERAGKLVFQEVENPHGDSIVTFMNLALFWYSQGLWRRSYIHKGNGTQTAYLLGFGTERPNADDSWESEVCRRRFWSCYLMHCHASESLFALEAGETVLKLALPWREEDFDAGIPTRPKATLDSGPSNGGIFCELVKALTFWHVLSFVNSLVKSPESSISTRVTAIHALHDRISDWWDKIPASLRMTPSSICGVPQDALPNLLLLHIVHHQCLCALHSSIVPLFCWSPGDNSWLSARQFSAQVAYEHACAVSALIDSVIANYPRLGAIPSFVSYAAYCGCAIQIPFMWSSDSLIRERAHANVKANVQMIHTLAKYWKFSALLEIHVRYLYKIHARNPIVLENEPQFIDAKKLTSFKINAVYARESILGHNRILWTRGNGYAKQGEEVTDLGIEGENDAQSSNSMTATTGQDGTRTIRPQPRVPSPSSTTLHPSYSSTFRQESAPAPPPSIPPGPGSEDPYSQRPTASIQPEVYPPEMHTIDFFRPFLDPEMLDLFPHGEVRDFLHLDTSPLSLDFFDAWAPEGRSSAAVSAPELGGGGQ